MASEEQDEILGPFVYAKNMFKSTAESDVPSGGSVLRCGDKN